MQWYSIIPLLLRNVLTNADVEVEHCEFTKVQSTCRFPVHYAGLIDQTYYRKFVDAGGVPILGTLNVSNAALVEAARLIKHILENAPANYRDQIIIRGDRVVVLGRNEKLYNLPEFRNGGNLRKLSGLRGYNSLGVIVCAEENLLCNQNDDYEGYSVCIHEFAHSLDASFTKVDPDYKRLVVTAYRNAVGTSDQPHRLWQNTYAASDPAEYFAELTVAWFDASSKNTVPGSFNGIWSRTLLKDYDPSMSDLLTRVYGDGQWRYSCGDICPGPYLEDLRC